MKYLGLHEELHEDASRGVEELLGSLGACASASALKALRFVLQAIPRVLQICLCRDGAESMCVYLASTYNSHSPGNSSLLSNGSIQVNVDYLAAKLTAEAEKDEDEDENKDEADVQKKMT